MAMQQIPISRYDDDVQDIGSDGVLFEESIKNNDSWTKGVLQTGFADKTLLDGQIAAIIRQPDPSEPAIPGNPKMIIDVNKAWEVDVRWELTSKRNLLCFLTGFWSVKLFLESLGDPAYDREAVYPIDPVYPIDDDDDGGDGGDSETPLFYGIPLNPRLDTYHAQFKIPPFAPATASTVEQGLDVEKDEGTPFELTVAVVCMVLCNGNARPGPIIGKVNLPLIQAFKEEFHAPSIQGRGSSANR